MITYVTGNLFLSPAQVLVNTVNTVGVMGKGVAYEFKRIYPEMFEKYRALCEAGKLTIGDLWLYRSPNKWVLNFPTKKHWRNPSHPDYLEAGLRKFSQVYADWGIHSIAFPPLGCGNGELDFETQVRPLMERYLRPLPIDIFIYPDRDDPYLPEHIEPKNFREWLRTQPETLAFTEVWDDLLELLTNRTVFETTANARQFTAQIAPEEGGIQITASGRMYLIEKDTLLSFWQQLRSYGFSTRTIAPGVDREISYLIPIFSELPYIKPVKLADQYTKLSRTSTVGLQYIPSFKTKTETRQVQLSLFEM